MFEKSQFQYFFLFEKRIACLLTIGIESKLLAMRNFKITDKRPPKQLADLVIILINGRQNH